MSKQFLTLHKEFLKTENYEELRKTSQSLTQKYDQFCRLLQRVYLSLAEQRVEVPLLSTSIGFMQPRREFRFVAHLKQFIEAFTSISRDMALYQIDCLQRLRQKNTHELDMPFNQLTLKAREAQELNQSIDRIVTTLIGRYSEIREKYGRFEEACHDPLRYYQPQWVEKEEEGLYQQMRSSWHLMTEVVSKREAIHAKIDYFEPLLSTFRKKLVKNKYSVLQRLVFLVKNTKNATVEIFDALKRCALEYRQGFMALARDPEDDINFVRKYLEEAGRAPSFSEASKKVEKITAQCIQEFDDTYEDIEFILEQLAGYFSNFCQICSEQHQWFAQVATRINQYFQQSQSPYSMMRELLEIQLVFNKKFQTLVLRIQEIQGRLKTQRSACRKQSQILLTMVKVNKNSFRSYLEELRSNQNMSSLVQQISFRGTKTSLLMLYDEMVHLESQLLSQFEGEKHAQRKALNSMDLSHTEREPRMADKKVPLKGEYWLWKDCRSEVQINFQTFNIYYREIEKQMERIKGETVVKESTEEERHQCLLQAGRKQFDGTISVKLNALEFIYGDKRLCLPWKQVTAIKKQRELFNDFIAIETPKGSLRFRKIEQIDRVLGVLKDAQEKGLMGNRRKIERRAVTVMSAEQLRAIGERRERIRADVPELKGFEAVLQEQLPLRIEEVYQWFYSDQVFSLYGREEPCFFSYAGKKTGNYNWVAEGYDKAGPNFYSQQEVSFEQAPMFSSRKTSYNHPMKNTSIPFMPEFCFNQDIRKMYWISHQELLYLIESSTEGIPYADYFQVTLAHRLSGLEGGGTSVSISMRINWIKDTIMKGTIAGNIIPQVKANMDYLLAEMKKVAQIVVAGGTLATEHAEEEVNSETASLSPKPKDRRLLAWWQGGSLLLFLLLLIFLLL